MFTSMALQTLESLTELQYLDLRPFLTSFNGKPLKQQSNKSQRPVDGFPLVRKLETLGEFKAELDAAGEKLVVVDFTADWCGPSKFCEPKILSLADKYQEVVFVKVTDENQV